MSGDDESTKKTITLSDFEFSEAIELLEEESKPFCADPWDPESEL